MIKQILHLPQIPNFSLLAPMDDNSLDSKDHFKTPTKQPTISIQDISKWSLLSTKDYFYSTSIENTQKYSLFFILILVIHLYDHLHLKQIPDC